VAPEKTKSLLEIQEASFVGVNVEGIPSTSKVSICDYSMASQDYLSSITTFLILPVNLLLPSS
jgi:hypothetical protein